MGLEQYQGDMDMCCRCSTCKFIPMQMVKGEQYVNVCPSIARYNLHAYSAGGRLNIGSSMLKNGFNYTDKLLDIVYDCQMCGACGVSCNYAMDMEVLEPIHEFRMKTIADGHANPALEKVVTDMAKTGSTVPVTGKRGDWAQGLGVKDATREQVDVLLHVGCMVSYDKEMQKLAKTAVKILQKAGVDFGIAGDAETCCGGRTWQMGYKDTFIEQAKKAMDVVKQSGAKTVVTICADGYQAFKVLYSRYNLIGNVEVLHITECIDQLIKDGKLKLENKVGLSVTYHDPCRLGRLGEPWVHWEGKKIPGDRFVYDPPKPYRRGTNGVYEPPRAIIRSVPGVRFTEMTRIKEYAWCCGAGGGVIESNPEFAIWTATDRICEAQSTGAEAIVTACPWCEKTLGEAVKQSGISMQVMDIVELVEKAL